jgi:voltage-gated potassium channel
MELPRRIYYAAAAVIITLSTGTIGFVLVDDYSWFDAFYMTVITVFSIGYAEVRPLSHAGRVFNVCLILFGGVMFLGAIGAFTQALIELELKQFFGKRRVKHMVDQLKNHYIICGYGRVGRGAAEELKGAGVPFVIIDSSDDRVERAIRLGMVAVVGDCTQDETLRNVGIERAQGLIATLRTDADNLFLILSARSLNPALHLSARVNEEEAEQKMRLAGANAVFAPYTITGARMAQALLRPHVHQFIDFTTRHTGLNVGIEQVAVANRSSFAGKTLEQAGLRKDFGVIVLAIKKNDGKMMFNPPADATITEGDFLIVMGENPNLRKLEQLLA